MTVRIRYLSVAAVLAICSSALAQKTVERQEYWIDGDVAGGTTIAAGAQIDLTGQVCADSIGPRIYSGTGGQLDFVRGAKLSRGGKAIIALASRTRSGQPKIVPQLQPGAGVVTPRADVQWVVTEYGAVNLYGKSLQERAKLLISVAHPQDREALSRAAYERFGRDC